MHFSLYRYSLSLRHLDRKRSGILLYVQHDDGREGWGEMAPYPGRSTESLVRGIHELKAAMRALNERTPCPLLSPSVEFCLESALSFQPPSSPIPFCTLLTGSKEEMMERTHALKGFSHVKIKVSALSTRDIEEIVHALHPNFVIRLDANRSFSYEEAKRRFAHLPVEYIEEPTHELHALETLPFPFALDESLSTIEVLPQTKKLFALVLKPTIIGGKKMCSQWAKNHRAVLSSCYETGIGIARIAQMAQEMPHLLSPPGLDTYRFLENDVLLEPFRIRHGCLIPPNHFAVNFQRLEPISHD